MFDTASFVTAIRSSEGAAREVLGMILRREVVALMGVSLNQFINVAVAEKLAHLQNEEWVKNRKEPTPELAAWALKLLERPSKRRVEPGDELPPGYRSKLR